LPAKAESAKATCGSCAASRSRITNEGSPRRSPADVDSAAKKKKKGKGKGKRKRKRKKKEKGKKEERKKKEE